MSPVDMSNVHIAILAGGSGTRLWPRSRTKTPKQLLDLVGDGGSMLQHTVQRILPLVSLEHVYILTGPEHAAAIAAQLPQLPEENIFIEPSPRGTAPCLGLAALRLRRKHGGESIMISLHADHTIAREDRFRDALRAATATARKGHLVTVGLVPTRPETGFGYIERGNKLFAEQEISVYHVARFREKPPLDQAREFVESGRFYWNAGYFAWTLDNLLQEFERLLPETYTCLETMANGLPAQDVDALWKQIDSVSIDVGIMERARNVAVVPCDMGWSDVGSWTALYEILEKDANGNVVRADKRHVGLDTKDCLIYSEDKLVATIGLEDMIVVNTSDALLVLPKSRAQEVGALVEGLEAQELEEYL
ncbi:MAG: mannose-1-phosphate guanylyltransferase [Chloroflexota bacterium]|nr:mannose-1-phosphate guanylyltransferase [Chloroflexota bacterium]